MDSEFPTLYFFIVYFDKGPFTILTAPAYDYDTAEEMTWARSESEQWPICGRKIESVTHTTGYDRK